MHVPGDHKPGTFPRSLFIESLCPEDGHCLEDWQPGRRWGYEGCRGSCGSIGSQASTYDNMPRLCPAEPILAVADAEEGEDGASYAHLDDTLQHVWGLQQRVELWSQAVYPDLGPGDKEEEEEEEAISPVEIVTVEVEMQTEALAQIEALAHRESAAPGQADVQPVVPVQDQAQAAAKAEPLAQAEAETPGLSQDNEHAVISGREPTSASSLSMEEGHSTSDSVASSS